MPKGDAVRKIAPEETENEKAMPRGEEQPDVEAIMAGIRSRVKRGLAEHPPRAVPHYAPPGAKLLDSAVSPVLYSEELNFLNAHWNDWTVSEDITSHRAFIGPVIVRVKRALRNFLLNSLLKGYFERERQFQMQLVRHLNASARYIDARDAELFWQIVKKVDNDIAAINERADLLFDEAGAALAQAHDRNSARLDALERVREELSLALEGLRRDLLRQQGCFSDERGPVVELDCRLRDTASYLKELDNDSLGAIFARDISVDRSRQETEELLGLLASRVKPGGKLILEEHNPSAQWLREAIEASGIRILHMGSGPVAGAEQKLQQIEISDYMPMRWRETLETINDNTEKLNKMLAGRDSLFVIGEREVRE